MTLPHGRSSNIQLRELVLRFLEDPVRPGVIPGLQRMFRTTMMKAVYDWWVSLRSRLLADVPVKIKTAP